MEDWMDWFQERLGAIVIAALVVLGGVWLWQDRPMSQPPGVLAPGEPVQAEPPVPTAWTFREHTLTPLAAFEIQARVLSTERYRFDRAAQLSPVDFALGWGPMSDSRVLSAFTITQGNRWYFWRTSNFPIPEGQIISHSANMHMIPANPTTERRLLSVKPGQIVNLSGKLVRADGKDGWHWISSLSREDTGDGSCEVVWVESITVSGP